MRSAVFRDFMQRDNLSQDSSWNVMAHGDARDGKWRGNWRMDWVASTLHTTSEHGVSSITTADAHTSAASSRLNWHPHRFKWTRPFCRKTKSVFRACAITFQLVSTTFKGVECGPETSVINYRSALRKNPKRAQISIDLFRWNFALKSEPCFYQNC